MTVENFLKSAVKNLQNTHKIMLLTPRERMNSELRIEIAEFVDYCKYLQRGGEITKEFCKQIIDEINKIDFENLSVQRKFLKDKK